MSVYALARQKLAALGDWVATPHPKQKPQVSDTKEKSRKLKLREYYRQWRAKNRDKYNAYMRGYWAKKHPKESEQVPEAQVLLLTYDRHEDVPVAEVPSVVVGEFPER